MDSQIHFIRGQRVMLDSDLAIIYGVTTKRLNEQFRRNRHRFPSDFAFQLAKDEFQDLRSQIATSSYGGRRYRPFVFTEHGAIMVASVLNSARAVEMSVFVVRAFVQMREVLMGNRRLAAKLAELEKRVGGHDEVIADLITAIRRLLETPAEEKPKREIGFHMRETSPPYRISRRR
ncbi:MAG TPA: ORF6N domain-containing protein [Candidatus Limnocylindria bacterium]|nr:ORF6N domain-containing protein [Candidatus Limnocylindria bacterium]